MDSTKIISFLLCLFLIGCVASPKKSTSVSSTSSSSGTSSSSNPNNVVPISSSKLRSIQAISSATKMSIASQSTAPLSSNINMPYDLYLFSYSATAKYQDGAPRFPKITNPDAKNVFVRHVGVTFDLNTNSVGADTIQFMTGIPNAKLYGSSSITTGSQVPTFVAYNPNEISMYIDTVNLAALGYFPLSQSYCKTLGLGGPQITLGQDFGNQAIFPWSSDNKKLTLAVDYQLPSALYKVRNAAGVYESKDNVKVGDHAPIFQSALFLYLQDTISSKTVAVLLTFYDPRGAYEAAVSNDNNVFFYTAPLAGKDAAGTPLTAEFSAEGASAVTRPFLGYKNFKFSISNEQIKNIMGRFDATLGLSQDLTKLKIVSVGFLNEMSPIFQGLDCVSNFDPQTFSKVGMSFKNFSLAIEDRPNTPVKFDIDSYNKNGNIIGWAYDPDVTLAPVSLNFFIDGLLAGTINTNSLRTDVNSAFSIAGIHGFQWAIPSVYKDNKSHSIRIEAKDLNANVPGLVIGNSSFLFKPNTPVKSYIDSYNQNGRMLGWAYDPDVTSGSVSINFFVDGLLAKTINTNSLRTDVNTAFNITGTHGFEWTIPTIYRDGKSHAIRIEAKDLNEITPDVVVGSSSILLENIPVKSYLDFYNQNGNIIGWAFDPDVPNESVAIKIIIDGAIAASISANEVRDDINSVFKISGQHGFLWRIDSKYKDGQNHNVVIEAYDKNNPTLKTIVGSTLTKF